MAVLFVHLFQHLSFYISLTFCWRLTLSPANFLVFPPAELFACLLAMPFLAMGE